MKYTNKRNGKIFEQIGTIDSKYKTVVLREEETGKEQSISVSTLKRWYAAIEEESEEVIPAEEENPEEVIPAEAEPEKENKTEKKERKQREMTAEAKTLHEYVLATCEKLGGEIFVPKTDIKFRGLKVGGHMFIKYHWSNKSVTLQVRAQALGLETPKNPANHTFNDKYIFREDTEETRKKIFDIMKTCYDWQLCKNLSRENREKNQ